MAKELRALAKLATANGWTVREVKAGMMFTPADKSQPNIVAHNTTSDHRATLNLVSRLRRAGLAIPH